MDTFPDVDYIWRTPKEGTATDQFKTYSPQNPDFTIGTVFKDVASGIGSVVSAPIDYVKSTVMNTWFYLVGGVALIGIIAIVVLGASSRVMARMEGR